MSRRTRRTSDSPAKLDARIDAARLPHGVTRDSERADAGWGNVMMGLADLARDKRESSIPLAERHTYGELMELYRGNDLAARICDRPAEDMTREGFETSIDGDEQAGDDVDAAADDLQVLARFNEALRKSSAAGGAAVLIGAVDKAGDPSLPLDEKRLERVDFLTVLDAREIYPTSYYADPFAPKFGLPRTYRVQPAFLTGSNAGAGDLTQDRTKFITGSSFAQVHESRIIRFEGVNVNRWQMRETLGWGDSKLERPWKVLRNHDIGWDAASYLLTDFAQAVFKMDGLKEAVTSGNAKLVQDRAAIMEMQRSFMRMVLIGKDDEFERKPTPLSGLPETLDRLSKRLAAAADMPVTILFGESPAGLNATGSNEVRNYYDRIKARQKTDLLPQLRRILRLLFLSKRGPTGGVEPEKWNVTFRSLWQPTDQETATAYQAFAAGDASNVNAGILEPEEIAISRYGGRKFGTVVRIQTESREKFLAENPPGEAKAAGIESGDLNPDGSAKVPPPPPPGSAPASGKEPPADPAAPKA
jgi:phage-related protein (TIGR01555 family)